MLAWMLYATAIGLIVAGAAFALDGVAAIWGLPRRAVWLVAIAIAVVVPPTLAFRRAPVRATIATDVQRVSIPFGGAAAVAAASVPAPPPRLERLVIDPAWDRGALLAWLGASIALLGLLARTFVIVRRHRSAWRESEVDGHRVLIAGDVGPAVIGALRPRIVLPTWALTLDDAERRMMLRHESEHVEAGDPLLLLAGAIVVALFPWNPALWLLVRRLRLAIEIDCDRRVLRVVDAPREYGMLLLAVGARQGRPLPLAASLAERQPLLERRILAMTSLRPDRPLVASLPFAAVLAAAGVVAAQTPRPVSLVSARLGSARAMATTSIAAPPTTVGASSADHDRPRIKGDPVIVADAVATDSAVQVNWENAPIDNVLDAFARFAGRRITHTARVTGTITATASGERWNEALVRIMREHGYGVDLSADPIMIDAAAAAETKQNVPLDTIVAWIARYHPDVVRGNGHPNRVTIVVGLDESYLASSAEDANTASPQKRVLDRNDIESVEVLKGADAIAAYGPAADHGIVLIRTKAAGDSVVYDDDRLRAVAAQIRTLTTDIGQLKINRGPTDPVFVVDGVVVPASEVARAGLVAPPDGGVASMHIAPTRILQVDVLKLPAGRIGPDATSVILIQLKDNGR